MQELMSTIKLMEEQKGIWDELKASPLIESGVEELKSFDCKEMDEYYKAWSKSIEDLNSAFNSLIYEEEIKTKEEIQIFIERVKDFSMQVQDYYKLILFKKYLTAFFQRFNLFVMPYLFLIVIFRWGFLA